MNGLPVPPELAGIFEQRKPGEIYHIDIPQLPELHFELHPLRREVWMIPKVRVATKGAVASVHAVKVADGVDSPNTARRIVLMWARGYMYGKDQRP